MVTAEQLRTELITETLLQSGHQENRTGQLHMSDLYLPEEEIIRRFREGNVPTEAERLKFHRGNVAEQTLHDRLQGIAFRKNLDVRRNVVIYGFEMKLIGHFDAAIDNTGIEYKSVPTIAILQDIIARPKLPYKVFAQVQSYMFWGTLDRFLVVYEAREGGEPHVVEVRAHLKVQLDLKHKAEYLVKTLFIENVTPDV